MALSIETSKICLRVNLVGYKDLTSQVPDAVKVPRLRIVTVMSLLHHLCPFGNGSLQHIMAGSAFGQQGGCKPRSAFGQWGGCKPPRCDLQLPVANIYN